MTMTTKKKTSSKATSADAAAQNPSTAKTPTTTAATKTPAKNDANHLLLKSNLKQLRLPTMKAEFEQLAREAAQSNQTFEQYLLRLTELEVSARASNTLNSRIKQAQFPVHKDLDTYDFSALPSLNKQKVLELARGDWITQHANVCLLGQPGTGKTHLSIALGLAACREGVRTKFFTAAALVNQLEEAQKKFGLDQLLKRLDKIDLLIVDELGYLSFSRSGAELLFQVFADRYERRSLLITSNLSFSDWDQIFQGERMTAALLDRLTHHCHIFEMNGESFRFKESMKEKKKPGTTV
ncbi:MAG: DNA replication protein DnaC [Planctomycetaceae bacterium]|jgi:DNA replication protein DnaC